MLDLDALFKAYLKERQESDENSDGLEDDLQDVYRRWLDKPNDALYGVKPGQLFARSDPEALIDAFLSYHQARLPLPEQILDAIGDSRLCETMLNEIAIGQVDSPQDARQTAMELLCQTGSAYALPACLVALDTQDDDDISDLAMDLLAARGDTILEDLLAALQKSSAIAADRICALLSEMPPNESIFSLLMSRFAEESADVGYFASLLRRYGDERARPALEAAMESGRAKRYADFVSLKDAIEAFGGQVTIKPDYPGDPDFERISEA